MLDSILKLALRSGAHSASAVFGRPLGMRPTEPQEGHLDCLTSKPGCAVIKKVTVSEAPETPMSKEPL